MFLLILYKHVSTALKEYTKFKQFLIIEFTGKVMRVLFLNANHKKRDVMQISVLLLGDGIYLFPELIGKKKRIWLLLLCLTFLIHVWIPVDTL